MTTLLKPGLSAEQVAQAARDFKAAVLLVSLEQLEKLTNDFRAELQRKDQQGGRY